MPRVSRGAWQQIRDLHDQGVQQPDVAKPRAKVVEEVHEPGVGAVSGPEGALADGRARDFAAAAAGAKTGGSPMAVRLGVVSPQTLDDLVRATPWDDLRSAKVLMSDQDFDAFVRGEMSAAAFKGFLEQANSPTAKDRLRHFYPKLDEVYGFMTSGERSRIDAGLMSPIEFDSIQGEMQERQAAAAGAASNHDSSLPGSSRPSELDQPAGQKIYEPADIMHRIESGTGHNVMFAGQLMDRAVLRTMLAAIRGDGRITQADVHKFLPQILDADTITTAEENAILFGFKYCRFTEAADRELTRAIADRYPDSAVARFGSLGQPPRFKNGEEHDLPDLAGRSAELYGAKGVMSPEEFARWSDGNMTLAEFNSVLERANQPAAPEALRGIFSSWTAAAAIASMTDAERARFDSGKMCPAEFQNLQYRGWEEENPSLKGKSPYRADYQPGFRPFVVDDVHDPDAGR